MFRAHPFWFTLMLLFVVGGIVLAAMAKTSPRFATMPWMFWVGVGVSAAGVLWWLGWWAAPHRWVKLVITNKRTIRQEGIVMRRTSEVLHSHVTNITINQGLLQRILNVGSIAIDSAGQGGDVRSTESGKDSRSNIEIEVHNIPRPYAVKQLIDRHRGI
jgi:uncharacterized membrane protein YdbT with pleckstrin-like domain